MVARTSTLENSLGFILSDISRLARKEFDRRVRELRLTRAQWLVLMHLARRPGCTQSDLADAMLKHIDIPAHPPLKAGVLYGMLDNDGWRLPRVFEGYFTYSWKAIPAECVTATISYSGLSIGSIGSSPDQLLRACTFLDGIMTPEDTAPGKTLLLSEVPPVAYSETIRRVLRLIAAANN